MKVRLGAVSYLNTRPLIVSLEAEKEAFDLAYGVPSACAADLREERIDLGLIPSIEYARSDQPYWIVPDVAIGSQGEVLTVRLFFRGDIGRLQRVALDRSSRTSAALLRILLSQRYDLHPQFVDAEPDIGQMLERADAALVIGDPVFDLLEANLSYLDLGQEWEKMTGLPFVYAFWAGRRDLLAEEQVQRLVEARVQGVEQIAAIARQYSFEHGGSFRLYERYLSYHIHFELGREQIAGLSAFFELARKYHLIEAIPPLRFYEGHH